MINNSKQINELIIQIEKYCNKGTEILLFIFSNEDKSPLIKRLSVQNEKAPFIFMQNGQSIVLSSVLTKYISECRVLIITIKTPSNEISKRLKCPYLEIRLFRVERFERDWGWELIDAISVFESYTTLHGTNQYIPPAPNEIYCDENSKIYGDTMKFIVDGKNLGKYDRLGIFESK